MDRCWWARKDGRSARVSLGAKVGGVGWDGEEPTKINGGFKLLSIEWRGCLKAKSVVVAEGGGGCGAEVRLGSSDESLRMGWRSVVVLLHGCVLGSNSLQSHVRKFMVVVIIRV